MMKRLGSYRCIPTGFGHKYSAKLGSHEVFMQLQGKQAKALAYDLWRVIFDPGLQPNLFRTQYGAYLKNNTQFSTRRSWVRHDDS